jgi:alpha 1,2-mannosyltransferase
MWIVLSRYRNMCRFNSGVSGIRFNPRLSAYLAQFFFRHELMQQFRYYWRVEWAWAPFYQLLHHNISNLCSAWSRFRPNVNFYCELQFDPFLYMQDHRKTYGFTMSLFEFGASVPTLWKHTKGMLQSSALTLQFALLVTKHSYLFFVDFMMKYPRLINKDSATRFITDDGGKTYNNCHCEHES